MTPPRHAGFTLLEVMVAVVILAVGLSSLFTSEVGAIRIAQRARTTTVASLLARCKMAEVEERIMKEGWPGTSLDGRDECCEGAEQDGYSCEYKVERIVLPDQDSSGDDLKSAATDPAGALGAAGSDPMAALSGLASSALLGGGGSGDPLAAMVIEYTFPIMKPQIEEQVRRATVTVNWKEGSSAQALEVVQFLVNELPIVVADDEELDLTPPPPPP